MKDVKDKEKFIELRAQGWSYERIGNEIGVSKPTLFKWNVELSHEIAEAKVIELDAVLEKFKLTKRHRVEAFAKQLRKFLDELEGRDLKDVKTDKLLEMAGRLMDLLAKEAGATQSTVESPFEMPGLGVTKEVFFSAFD